MKFVLFTLPLTLITSVASAQVREVIEQHLRNVLPPIRESVIKAIESSQDPSLVLSVIQSESQYDHRARSSVGARGLLQVMPETFRRESLAIGMRKAKIDRPEDNVRVGISYLQRLRALFGRTDRALMAYNWGPGNMLSGRRIPGSVREYARRILRRKDEIVLRYEKTSCANSGMVPICWAKPICI